MKKLLPTLVLLAAIGTPTTALAAPPSLALTHEQGSPGLPCYSEGADHHRVWRGKLTRGASFTVSLRFCDPASDGLDANGVGFVMATTPGPVELAAVTPSGVEVPAHLIADGSQRRCFVPPEADEFNAEGTIEAGTWTVTLSNTRNRVARDVVLEIIVGEAYAGWQRSLCPPEDSTWG